MCGVAGVAGAYDDKEVGSLRSRAGYQCVRRLRVVQRHHQRLRGVQMQAAQQLDLRHVAVVDRLAALSLPRHPVWVAVDRDVRDLMHVQHSGDHLPDPAEPGDDRQRFGAQYIGWQQGRVYRPWRIEARREAVAHLRQ